MVFDDLVARVEAIAERRTRVIVGIAGAPGSGKSTLATALVEALGERAAYLPMDGFHLANATLDRLGRRERKGALDTFDGAGFVALIKRIREEASDTVYAPSFRRDVDEPIAGEIAIEASAQMVIVEGNYLLVDEGPWAQIRCLLDEAWFCEAPEEVRLTRLIERHMRGGRSREDAERYARDIDGANAAVIDATAHRAMIRISGTIDM